MEQIIQLRHLRRDFHARVRSLAQEPGAQSDHDVLRTGVAVVEMREGSGEPRPDIQDRSIRTTDTFTQS
jgi:hypothetical protein